MGSPSRLELARQLPEVAKVFAVAGSGSTWRAIRGGSRVIAKRSGDTDTLAQWHQSGPDSRHSVKGARVAPVVVTFVRYVVSGRRHTKAMLA